MKLTIQWTQPEITLFENSNGFGTLTKLASPFINF